MMRRLVIPALCLAAAACGGDKPKAAEAPPVAAAPPAPAAPSGQAVYQRTCGTCHQANGLGTPNAVPPLARSPFASGDKALMIRIVLHGVTGPITVDGKRFNGVMPPWKALPDADIAAVLTYVRSSFGNTGDAVSVADVAAERAASAARTTPLTAADLH